jgi:murein lipoprotein
MRPSLQHPLPVCLLLATLGTALSGCATTSPSEMEALKEEIRAATEAANRAAAGAEDARREAARAAKLAEEAKTASEHANRVALDAQAISMETDARIDRMFKKAMYK